METNQQDSRSKLIYLTDKGREYKMFTDSLSRQLMDICWKGFSKNEQEELMKLLARLSDNLE